MPKIDLTQFENYTELSAEEKVALFESYEYEDKVEEIENLKKNLSRANGEVAEWKKKHNALLSVEEQNKLAKDEEMQTLLGELETLKKDKAISDLKANYLGLGYDETLALDTAEAQYAGNFSKVIENQKKFNNSLTKNIKAEVLKSTPAPEKTGINQNNSLTKDDFLKLSYQDKVKLYNENPELYESLRGEEQ